MSIVLFSIISENSIAKVELNIISCYIILTLFLSNIKIIYSICQTFYKILHKVWLIFAFNDKLIMR